MEKFNVSSRGRKKLIVLNSSIVYNKQHVIKKKEKNQRKYGINGFPIKVKINGKIYNSIQELKKKYNRSWKVVNKRLNDNVNYSEWEYYTGGLGTHSDSNLNSTGLLSMPKVVYVVGNKVFKSKRSIIGLDEFGKLSKSAIDNRFKSVNFPEWQQFRFEDFLKKQKNVGNIFEFMWQRSNDHPGLAKQGGE